MHHPDTDLPPPGLPCQDACDEEVDVPVLVVGAGPTGLLLAHLLSRLHVRTLIVEKYPRRLAAPKAHALSPRSLEICRQFGVSTRGLRSLGTGREDAYWVNFVTQLNGERIGRLPYERMDVAVLDDTPEMIHNIPQPDFESFIAALACAETGGHEMRKGCAFVACRQDDAAVTSILEERATGRKIRVHSKFLIGCDGAKSAVRSSLGIGSTGEDSFETMMTIHFRADVRSILGPDRVGMLHWIMDPAASGFVIGYDLADNMVLISNFDADAFPVESWTVDHCLDVLRAAVGADVPIEVLSYRPWILSRKIAERYRDGRVFLAGDAAHSFPPTGGLGLNCGIADVHNLAYKLAAVYHGNAGSALLDTYGVERRPVADIYARQSEKNGKEIFSFLKTLGTAGIKNVAEARENLLRSIHDPSKQAEIAAGVEGQREHFDNLELHLGYVYGHDKPPAHASHYTPRFVAGARLPHLFIEPSPRLLDTHMLAEPIDLSYVDDLAAEDRALRRYSILDLCQCDAFTVVVGVHSGLAESPAETIAGVKLNVYVRGRDFSTLDVGHYLLYEEIFSSGGGFLIRPDQHILKAMDRTTTMVDVRYSILKHLDRIV